MYGLSGQPLSRFESYPSFKTWDKLQIHSKTQKPIPDMAKFSMTNYLTTVILFICGLKVLSAEPSCPVVLNSFHELPRCRSEICLYGDAMVVNGGSSVQLTSSDPSSSGRLMYKKPIKLVEGNPPTFPSFSTIFSFSMSNKYIIVLQHIVIFLVWHQ